MEYARNVPSLMNAFDARELSGEDLQKYYCDGTMFARIGMQGRRSSPIGRLCEACKHPSMNG